MVHPLPARWRRSFGIGLYFVSRISTPGMSTDRDRESSKEEPFLSVVIPAFDEEQRIVDTLGKVVDYLGSQSYTWEVVVVDDGSTDDTASVVSSFSPDCGNLSLISVSHGGKGWAVNKGMLRARGEYRFLCDADLSMPIEHLSRFLPPENGGYDIAIGSREIPGARRMGEPYGRHLMGRVYNLLVRLFAVPHLADTQCGFKCFRGQVVQRLFPLQRVFGFAFDVEILFLALKKGFSIREVPIDWHHRDRSKVSPFRDSVVMTSDILRVRLRHLRGRYRDIPGRMNQDALN